ncbi:uridine kinase family protein [Albibacterium bauzanense]|uniref:Uridine kinase n=1 Tax=Albibacterium bauzanense TaxID=653929 RepID=A0A4V2PX87_9SPHI|nr:uridine kinase [Albibacterium bauzanense]TCK80741.1 uridine kinase [Albibacterium bauzanense]
MTKQSNQKPYIIGVAGNSGSGKTFFLNCFLKHFKPGEISLISLDNYYIPAGTKTKEENKRYNFDLPSAFDKDAFYNDIKSLIEWKTITKEEYTFNNPLLKPRVLEIKPSPILIIEGLFIFYYKEINTLIDHRIFMHTDEKTALARRLKRDFTERGYNEEDVLYKWNNHVIPAYHQYLLPFKESCNQIINNSIENEKDIDTISKDISAYLRQAFF